MSEEQVQDPYKDWPVWDCELHKAEGASEVFTVGVLHELRCTGDHIEKFEQSPSFKFKEAKYKYSMVLLKPVVIDHQSATLSVTSYLPGDYALPFVVSDGFTGFRVENLKWKVTSVIEKGVKQEPYGPIGPFQLSMPWWFWFSVIFVLVLIGIFGFRKVRKHQARKRLLEELEAHTTALSPFNQFSKDMRMILRKYEGPRGEQRAEEYFERVDEAFRLYLIRELKVPALDWRPRAILGEIKSRHKKVYIEAGDDIRKILLELEKARKVLQNISPVDCEQLASMSRQVADQVYRLQRKRSS